MMRGTSIGEYSSGDDSSDIRTVRTNATNVFSQASTYYTNPTLPPPTRHMILNPNQEDEEDQTTLTDDVSSLDYTSPTSIMTNYESYSKFGAAPIYQNVLIPTTNAQRRAQQQQQATNNNKTEVFSLNTIVEENTTKSPTKVYHPPSYYKNQRRTTSNTPTTASSTPTPTPTTAVKSTDATQAAITTTKSYDDGSTVTDHLTTGSTSAASRTTSTSSGTGTTGGTSSSHGKHSNHPHSMIPPTTTTHHGLESKKENRTSSSSPTPPTNTAFSIFKRMTTVGGNSPLRNRSQSSSPVPTVSSSTTTIPKESNVVSTSSTMSTGSNSSISGGGHSDAGAKASTGSSSHTQPPQPTRSLRNYMHTLAYKSRRNNSPNTIPSGGRETPPPLQSKKSDTDHIPISPTASIHSATSHHSSSGNKNTILTSPPSQELIATPIKSNSSSSSNPIQPKDLTYLNAVEKRDMGVMKHHNDDVPPKTKASATCPTTTSTMTSTSSSGSSMNETASNTPYYNPVLKSVSSKLFLPSEDIVSSPPHLPKAAIAAVPTPVYHTDDTRTILKNDMDAAPKARLNLDIIDHLAATTGGDDITQLQDLPPPKESFRLWTDEDSAFGASWYSFSTSPFVGEHDDTINTSMESNHSAVGAAGGGGCAVIAAAVTSVNVTSTEHPRFNVPTDPNSHATRMMIAPPVTTIIPPDVIPPSGKLSLSLLQLKHLHRTSSIGSMDDDEDTIHRYPSMVSSEYEDEGGASTLSGTINNPTDDCTTLGGGPSFDFSVSACVDDESLTNNKEKVSTTPVAKPSRSNPIVYSNVGQAFSRGDMIPTQPMNTTMNNNNSSNVQKSGLRFVPPLDRPLRRRSSSTGKRSLSTPPQSPLEVIDEHLSHDHKLSHLQESASEPSSSAGHTATDTMVVVSLADASASSSKKQPSSQGSGPTEGHKEETIRVVRRLDSVQIGIILLISVALAAIICATFCIVGSCQVGKNKNSNNRVLAVTPFTSRTSPASPTHYLRSDKSTKIMPMPVLPP